MAIPRESVEFVAVAMTVDGEPATPDGISVCAAGVRPTTWITPTILEDKSGFLTGTYGPATYTVWARASDDPETPVVRAGTLTIT
jgi:hypothetical protein